MMLVTILRLAVGGHAISLSHRAILYRHCLVSSPCRLLQLRLHPWDRAHGILDAPDALGLASSAPIDYSASSTPVTVRGIPRCLYTCVTISRNLTGDGPAWNAIDPGSSFSLTSPSHGTATLGMLAASDCQIRGNRRLRGSSVERLPEVVPIRIADSVIYFRTGAIARGIEYAADVGCQVVSISMGGVPTQLWADAVNKAYEQGMCTFAAAGNRIGPALPATLVYLARFKRVVGVCGFTAARTLYFRAGFHHQMHGCFGPLTAMKTAMAAFTPNIAWAEMGCGSLVNPDGAGTSSATPQCAVAATLWLQKCRPAPAEKWRIVEAVRHAMFSTADKSPVDGEYCFGNGLLQAKDALAIAFRNDLPQTPVDEVSFPGSGS